MARTGRWTGTRAARWTPRVLRIVGYGLVVGFLGVQLWRGRDGLADGLRTLGPARCAVAAALIAVGTVPGMLAWRVLLAGVGIRLELPVAARVYYVAGLAKYLPGGLWPVVAHADLATRLREPPTRLAAAFLGSVAVSVISGLTVGLLGLTRLADQAFWWVPLPLLAGGALVLAVPRALNAALAVAGRVLRRPASPPSLPGRPVLIGAMLWSALGWLITGLHVAVLAGAFGPVSVTTAAQLAGGFALSMSAGIAAVFLPAGLGAREIVFGFVLAGLLTWPEIVVVIGSSRLLVTLADCLLAGAFAAAAPARPADSRTG